MYMYMWEARWLFRLPMRAQLDVTARSSPGHATRPWMPATTYTMHGCSLVWYVCWPGAPSLGGDAFLRIDESHPPRASAERRRGRLDLPSHLWSSRLPGGGCTSRRARRSFVIAGARWTRRRPGPRLTDRSALSKRGDRVRDLHTTSRL